MRIQSNHPFDAVSQVRLLVYMGSMASRFTISECISFNLTDVVQFNPNAGPETLIYKHLSELPARCPDGPKHRKCHIAALLCSGRSLAILSASKSCDRCRAEGDGLTVTGGVSMGDSESFITRFRRTDSCGDKSWLLPATRLKVA